MPTPRKPVKPLPINGQKIEGVVVRLADDSSNEAYTESFEVYEPSGRLIGLLSFRQLVDQFGAQAAWSIRSTELRSRDAALGQRMGKDIVRKVSGKTIQDAVFRITTDGKDEATVVSYTELESRYGKKWAKQIWLSEKRRPHMRAKPKGHMTGVNSRKSKGADGHEKNKRKPIKAVRVVPHPRDDRRQESHHAPLRELLSAYDLDEKERRRLEDLAEGISRYGRAADFNELLRLAKLGIKRSRVEGRAPREVVTSAVMPGRDTSHEERESAVSILVSGIQSDSSEQQAEETTKHIEFAHLFVFDDDAFDVAVECDLPLENLPYETCIVCDVLLRQVGSEVRVRALASGADEEAAKRLMSFVVNKCTSLVKGNGCVDYQGRGKSVHRLKTGEHVRRGHWRNQACGPGLKDRKRIWIHETVVGTGGKPYRISDPTRVHRVSLLKDENGVGRVTSVEVSDQ